MKKHMDITVIRKMIPLTKWQREMKEIYAACAEHVAHEDLQPYMPTIFSEMRKHARARFNREVVLIQVGIGSSGGYIGVFVPLSVVDPEVDDITLYSGDKFSLMDLSALFNAYFHDLDYDPGFYVDIQRDSLRLKGMTEYVPPRFPGDTEPGYNTIRITDYGRRFIEKMLEFHEAIYRPLQRGEMFFPQEEGVKYTGKRRRNPLSSEQSQRTPYADCHDLRFDAIERAVRAGWPTS